jgi:hypothetical protein
MFGRPLYSGNVAIVGVVFHKENLEYLIKDIK